MKIVILAILLSCSVVYAGLDRDAVPEAREAYFQAVVDAIWVAEGGAKTRHPFGVLSVECRGYDECRRVCYNTVRNNWYRWEKAGNPGKFLEFLQKRYAPLNAVNDKAGLNRNWLRNVESLIQMEVV